MQLTEKIIDSSSGHKIPLMIRMPEGDPKGVIQINTGTCIPQKIYWRFAEYLTENGYITITYDYTDAQNFKSGVTHVTWIKDITSVFDFVLKSYPGLKKIMVGHSSGGQFIGYLPNSGQVDKIYLVASANGYWKLMDGISKYGMWLFWNIVVPLNIRFFGYFNNKMFGAGGGFPKNIILELRSFCQQKEFFLSYFKSHQVPYHYDNIYCRVTAYQLQGDVIANDIACRWILGLYKNAKPAFVQLRASDYSLKRFGHRSFFSSTSKKIWEEFLADVEKC